MKVNRRTWTLLIVAVAVIGGVYAITVWQRTRETRRLLEELQSPDHAVAARAMISLRERIPSIREQLIADARQGAGPVRWRSITLLAEARDAASRDVLMSALQDPDPTVRAAATMSLGKRHVKGAADRIAMLAAAEEEPIEVRLAAVRALQALKTGTHLTEVSEIATNRPPPPPEEPEEAPLEEVAEAPAEGAEAEAEETWSDDTAELRVEAVRAVAILGATARSEQTDAASVPPAVAAMDVLTEASSPEEHNDEVRQAACYAIIDLAQLTPDEDVRRQAIDALLAAGNDEIGDVRIAAVYGLDLLPTPTDRLEAVASAMQKALNDPHYWVRIAAGEEPIGG